MTLRKEKQLLFHHSLAGVKGRNGKRVINIFNI